MGMYDTYGELGMQLKNGPCIFNHYKVGDLVPLLDGIYVSLEGSIVVQNRVFIAEFSPNQVKDKWGGTVDVSGNNPVSQAMSDYMQKRRPNSE